MLLKLLRKKLNKPSFQPGWLVFSHDEQGLRWLHMVGSTNKIARIMAWGHLPPPGTLVHQLGAIALHSRLNKYRCLATLQMEEYQIVQSELPSVPEEELRQALRWSIRELVDYSVDDIGVDYLLVPGDKNRSSTNRSAYVICAQRSALNRYTEAFSSLKGSLHVCDVPETAHRNLSMLCAANGNSNVLLGISPDYSILTFTLGEELCMARRIEVGLTLLERSTGDQRLALFDRILLEVQRSLDAFERQFHFAPLKRVCVSPLPDSVDLVSYLEGNLDLPVETFDFTSTLDFSSAQELIRPNNLAAYLTLIGAGLRDEDALEGS